MAHVKLTFLRADVRQHANTGAVYIDVYLKGDNGKTYLHHTAALLGDLVVYGEDFAPPSSSVGGE